LYKLYALEYEEQHYIQQQHKQQTAAAAVDSSSSSSSSKRDRTNSEDARPTQSTGVNDEQIYEHDHSSSSSSSSSFVNTTTLLPTNFHTLSIVAIHADIRTTNKVDLTRTIF
jgi:hypothetical protein